MEIVVIADCDTATGFRLAGIKRVYDPVQGSQNLKQVLSDDGVGVLILSEPFAEENRRAVDEHKASKRITPIVVEVPAVTGPIEREVDPIRELIRRAIGADIK